MQQITKELFKESNFRYREWYQGCGGKLEAEGSLSQVDKLAGLEAVGAWVAEPKRDGIWVIAFFDETGVQFYSRTQERKAYSLDKIVIPSMFGCALIGELGYGSQESIRRRAELGIDFMDVYDVAVVDYKTVLDLKDEDRRTMRDRLMFGRMDIEHPAGKHFIATPHWTSDFTKRFNAEPEGLILKPRQGGFPYTPGSRVKHWMKVKKDHTVDMVILGMEESKAETKIGKGMVEHLICGAYVNGDLKSLTKVGSMTHELQLEIAGKWPHHFGRVVELKHFGQFKSGALRHPSVVRLRDDKKPEDCTFDPDSVTPKSFKCVSDE